MRDIDLQVELESYARTELGHPGMVWIRGFNMEGGLSLVVTGTSALKPTYTEFPIGGLGTSPSVAQGASGEKITNNFVVDFIGTHHGYNADSTRTFFVKEPGEYIRKIYSELTDMFNNIVNFISPNVTAEETYNYATSFISDCDCDWKEWFMGLEQKVKFVGHGIGTEVNQFPVIAPKQKIKFEDNMVIAIEPKIFVPDYGIIGLENSYIMKNGRLKSLTGELAPIEEYIVG